MKIVVKLSVVALTILSLAACDPAAKKPAEGPDSASTAAKVDSNAKTGIDTGKKDTTKK